MTYFRREIILCLVLLLAVSLKAQTSLGGSDVVITKSGSVNTRSGCNERIMCQGMGAELMWRKLPSRVDLESNNDTITITTNRSPDGLLASTLSFTPITKGDDGTYSCIIEDENNRQRTQSLSLTVDADPLEITSMIGPIDISTYTVGETLSIACSIDTCASDIRVVLISEDGNTNSPGELMNPETSTYNLDLTVQHDSPGMYACRVETASPVHIVMHHFNITGTPIIPPGITLPPSIPSLPTDNGGTPDNTASPGSPNPSTTDDDDASLPLRINAALLSILLLLSLTLLLA